MNKGKDLKPHIGIFGRRNQGKSSLINVLVQQDVAIVDDLAGTTTDPVKKSIEIFGLGPAILIDTAGMDDEGELGRKRVKKSLDIIRTIDCGIIVISNNEFGHEEIDLIGELNRQEIPFILVHNKSDIRKLNQSTLEKIRLETNAPVLDFNTIVPHRDELIALLLKTIPETAYVNPALFEGIIKKDDVVLLITPIDSEAPEGRMILPQVMAIRDVLDHDAVNIVLKETQLEDYLKNNPKPALAVTDSQAFGYVSKIVPPDVPLTSFSILFARMRGDFENYIKGTPDIDKLQEGDRVLILESCTHQISCDDIGRIKLPKWLQKYNNCNLQFDAVPGFHNLPHPIDDYKLVIQCGGCVVTRKQLAGRLRPAIEAGIPVTNYGMSIAWINGIFDRVMEPFNKLQLV